MSHPEKKTSLDVDTGEAPYNVVDDSQNQVEETHSENIPTTSHHNPQAHPRVILRSDEVEPKDPAIGVERPVTPEERQRSSAGPSLSTHSTQVRNWGISFRMHKFRKV